VQSQSTLASDSQQNTSCCILNSHTSGSHTFTTLTSRIAHIFLDLLFRFLVGLEELHDACKRLCGVQTVWVEYGKKSYDCNTTFHAASLTARTQPHRNTCMQCVQSTYSGRNAAHLSLHAPCCCVSGPARRTYEWRTRSAVPCRSGWRTPPSRETGAPPTVPMCDCSCNRDSIASRG